MVFLKKTEEGYCQKNNEASTTKLEEKGDPAESSCCGFKAPAYVDEIALHMNDHDTANDLQS